MKTIAQQYSLLPPLDWGQDCHDQLYLMNRLWNTLVEIEHKHRERYRDIIGKDEAVAPLQAKLEELRARQSQLRAERKQQRAIARARVATPQIDARLKELATEIQSLAAQCKSTRAEAKARVKAPVAELNSEHFEAVKAARQNSGLYWGNYNAVCASYDTARSRAMKENSELRFRRFTGEGRFVVQIINGASVEDILGGKKQAAIDPTPLPVPGRGGKPLPRLRITAYTRERESRWLTFPIVYDRPFPEGCRVQQVVVTRRRVASQWRYAVTFTCRIDRPAVTTANTAACGINLGFRQDAEGLRVATIYSAAEGINHHHLSKKWMRAMDDVEAIGQRRDLALNEIHAHLKATWPHRPTMPDDVAERLENLIRAPKFAAASLAALTLRWRTAVEESSGQRFDTMTIPDELQMLDRLERWRKVDKLDLVRYGGWEVQANKREGLMLHRRQQYRLLARDLCARFGVIRIGKLDLRRMATLETQAGEENELHARARRNRQRASLYSLQQEIRLQAEKFGAVVEIVDGPVTSTCHACGSRCSVTSDVMHVCEECSAIWDQDENAARNVFASHRERASDDEILAERSRLADQELTPD